MVFNTGKINFEQGLKVGADNAPVKVVEYINLRCPDSKHYELKVAPYLDSYIEEGKVQRILKHFDKKSLELEKGSLMNQYLDYEREAESYDTIHQLFQEQEDWASHRIAAIPHLARDYGLQLEVSNQERAEKATEEIKAVGIERIPTVFVGDKAFVETIHLGDFKREIDSQFL
ncbi:MAG: DsbA family protein [Atopostipes sp.]|nr:DsbA family protein [Atopostipes sp.]